MALIAAMEADVQPRGFIERALVETMAVSLWRQWRYRYLEKILIDHHSSQMLPPSQAARAALANQSLVDHSKILGYLTREDDRCGRNIANSLRLLQKIRAHGGPSGPPLETPDSESGSESEPAQPRPPAGPTPEEQTLNEILAMDPPADDEK